MTDVLEKVPLDQETKNVLLGEESYLRPLYRLMLAQESGDWQSSAELAQISQAHRKRSGGGPLECHAMGPPDERQHNR